MTAELTGANHAIAVCNGSAALFTSLVAMGIGPGDEVIVPNFTFIASANAVILCGSCAGALRSAGRHFLHRYDAC